MVSELMKDALCEQTLPPMPPHWLSLGQAFVHQARMRPHVLAVADSTGARLTFEQLLVACVALANKLSGTLIESNCIGVLLPPSAGGAIANLAVTLLGKVAVNLNYSHTEKQLDACVQECGLKYIVTSSRFLKRVKLQPKAKLVILEEVREEAGLVDKIAAWLEAELTPEQLLGYLLPGLKTDHQFQSEQDNPHHYTHLDQPAAIIFTAGSTGDPKGVLLSHANILSNIQAIRLQGHVQPGEIILGVAPFFHSFGLTMTLWAPLCLGETVVYHYDPLDGRRIGELCEEFKATTLVSTPTMMSSYMRRCRPEQFASIRNWIVGGEKLKKQQYLAVQSKLGIIPLEGYGLAETGPVVACNVPGEVQLASGRIVPGTKFGTVGLPIPGTEIRIEDIDSGETLSSGQEGLIFVKGPQVMIGYLDQPVATAQVLKDGWFKTGDLGFLDDDGFLTVTGRISQFSKIAGEMVPHLAVEDEIMKVSAIDANCLSVTSVPDDKRGERLVVVYSNLGATPGQIVDRLKSSGICKLWIPQAADFIQVSELPVLRNGKLDLRGIHQIAAGENHGRMPRNS